MIWGSLAVLAFWIVIRLVDKFLFGYAHTHLIDAVEKSTFAVYLLSIYCTPCVICGDHLGWRVFLWWPGSTIVDQNYACCPHCGANINRDASLPPDKLAWK
jgi:hypothetical protein